MAKSNDPVVVLGGGGHAKVVVDILEEMGLYEIMGLVTKDAIGTLPGYKVLGDDGVLPDLLAQGVTRAAMGIGGFTTNSLRRQVYERAKSLGFEMVTVVHPSAVIAGGVSIGEGSVIFPGVVLNTQVRVGENVVVATGSTVDHETVVEANALISAGVTVGANVIIQEGALLAIGSTVVSGVSIGCRAVVGAGAVVLDDVPDGVTVGGVPARPLKPGVSSAKSAGPCEMKDVAEGQGGGSQ
jgi:UDP-perosamine 4-acetyltransferase